MAAKIFPFGTALTILWHFAKPDGSNFNVEGYTYRLYYRTGNKETEVESPMLSSSGNTITFTIPATAPVAPGEYALRLVLFQHGSLFCRFVYNNAFVLSRRMADASIAEEQTSEGSVVNLYTVAEYYMFSPVIPTVSRTGYWVVNGETVVDGRGNPVPSSHTLTYDEETGELVIDQGRRDGSGASIEQRITSLATALESQEERYIEAEAARGNLYAAAEAERNSEYESAESGRESAYQAAEGNKASSEAGDGSRWGEYKAAEGERTRLATEDHQQAVLDHQQAEYDHEEYESDHRRSGEDHVEAESDHLRAVEDHATATNDTSRAQEDHDRAEEDHTTAGTDHTRAESDHSRAETDHNTADGDHMQAVSDHDLAETDHIRAELDHSTATEDHETSIETARVASEAVEVASNAVRSATEAVEAAGNAVRSATKAAEDANEATQAANDASDTAKEAAREADTARENIRDELAGKTDKPSSATEGNLAKFDADRNPVDSTYKAGSPILSFSLVGEGNTYVPKQINGLQPGHRYRIYLDNWDTSEVTSGNQYTRFYVVCTSEGADLYLVREYMPCAQLPNYDLIVPEDVDSVTIGLRANAGSTVNIHIEDITAMYAELDEQRRKDLDAGLPVTLRFNDMMPTLERFQDNRYIYAANAELDTAPSIASQTTSYGYLNFKIPLIGGEKITLRQFGSTVDAGSIFVDENNKVVSCITLSETQEYTTYAPVSARYLFYTFTPSMRNTGFVTIQRIYQLKDLEQRLKMAREVTGEEVKLMRSSDDFRAIAALYSKSQYRTGSASSIGLPINEVVITKNNSFYNYLIPVEGWKTIGFRQYKSTANYGSAFLDENLNVISGILNTTDNYDKTASVPQNAKWFFYSCNYESVDYITFYPDKTISGDVSALKTRVDDLAEQTGISPMRTGAAPRYRSGILTATGGITDDDRYVTTEPIFGNFALTVRDNYRIYSGSLVDRNGNIVSHQHLYPLPDPSESQSSWSLRQSFSSLNMPPQYGYRLVICKADLSHITDDDTIIEGFVSMTDSGLHRWVPEDLPNYDVAQRRIEHMQRALWMPLAKVPDGSTASGDANVYFCLPGNLMTNVPYSDLGLTRKFVPAAVSMLTFLTAAKNKRSLLYTENLHNNTSKYGFDWSEAYRCGAYYGCACNAFTGWVAGFKTIYQSIGYRDNTPSGMSTVSNPTANNVRPLDFIWNEGHISMISDIFKDDYGKVMYVVWAEMTTPYCKRTIYTAEQFESRLSDRRCTVHRWTGWGGISEPPTIPGYNLDQIGGTDCDVPYNEDIQCFAGDYAAFATGDKIVLNARRATTYSAVELYKDDVLIQTIDISGMSADGIYDDNEDWVAVDLTSLDLAAGKYKARMTDGTNVTDYTYFEVMGISFSATQSGNTLTAVFDVTGGTAISLEKCQASGFHSSVHSITDSEAQGGSVSVEWSYNSTYPKLYLLVRGDYGTVVKVINYPTA